MELNGSATESVLVYPLLCIPRKCTNLETNCEMSDNVFIEVNITSPDTEGNETCIYNGFCNIKLVNDYDVQYKPHENDLAQNEDPNISIIIADNQNTAYDPQVWIDPSQSPYVYNHYDEAETQEYSVCTQTRSIMFKQRITKNVYNYKEAVRYGSYDEIEDMKCKKQECQPARSDLNMYMNDEYECGVFLSQLSEEIMNEKQTKDREEQKYMNIPSENGALSQLMSSDMQSVSKQRKTILYLGHEPRNGQTIQQIAYHDPAVGCPGLAGEVDNEVVIYDREESVIPTHKKYQCGSCYQIFDQISEYREHMGRHAGAKYPRSIKSDDNFKYICSDCGKTLKSRQKFEAHCLGHGDPEVECDKCRKVFASKFTLRNHRKIHARKYPCKYCTRTYAKLEELQVHTSKNHLVLTPEHTIKNHSFTCDRCGYTTEAYEDFKNHQDSHDKTTSSAEIDHSLFDDVTNESDIIQCDPDWKFDRVQNSTTDAKQENAEVDSDDESDIVLRDIQIAKYGNDNVKNGLVESESCQEEESCDEGDAVIAKVMANKAFLAKKTRRSRRYSKICNVCRKRFDRISDLKRHLIEHVVRVTLAKSPVNKAGILNLQCEVCQDTFHYVDRYKAHLREHAKLTIYKCTFCDKCFSDSSNFSKHKKIHGATYYQCDLCQRKFNSKKMLIRHIEYHNTNKPIPCRYCKKEFHFESMLNKHVKSAHMKEISNKFRCRFCFNYYRTLKEKWDHEWKVHNVRKMVVDCRICDSQFRKYAELKRHCSDKHKMEIPLAKRLLKNKKKK